MKKLFFFFILLITAGAAFAQPSKDILINTIKEGDIEKLYKLLEDEVYLTIPNNKGSYSKENARSAIHTFWGAKAPKDFIFKHEGTSNNNNHYLIGQLQTQELSYRTYLLYTAEAGIIRISELRIESEE